MQQEILEDLLEIDPHNAEHLTKYSRALVKTGQFKKSMKILELILELHPENINALLALGDHYLRQGQYDLARNFLDRAEAIAPRQIDVLKLKLQFQSRLLHFDDSIKLAQEILEMGPNDARILFIIVDNYLKIRDFPQSEKYLQRLLDIDSNSNSVVKLAALTYFHMGKYSKAIYFLEKGYHAQSAKLSWRGMLALSYFKTNQFFKAIPLLRMEFTLEHGTDETHRLQILDLLSRSYFKQGLYHEALQEIGHYRTYHPIDDQIRITFIQSLIQAGIKKHAYAELKKVKNGQKLLAAIEESFLAGQDAAGEILGAEFIGRFHSESKWLLDLAAEHQSKGRHHVSIRLLTLLDQTSQPIDLVRQRELLAQSYYQTKDFERSLKNALIAESINHRINPLIPDSYFQLGKYSEAIAYLEEAITLFPDDKKMNKLLALSYLEGKWYNHLFNFLLFSRENSHFRNDFATTALAKIYLKSGQYKKIEELLLAGKKNIFDGPEPRPSDARFFKYLLTLSYYQQGKFDLALSSSRGQSEFGIALLRAKALIRLGRKQEAKKILRSLQKNNTEKEQEIQSLLRSI